MEIEVLDVAGYREAIRAMRLPMKSGDKSDSFVCHSILNRIEEECCKTCPHRRHVILSTPRSDHDVLFECRKDAPDYIIGPKDHSLSMKLIKAGPDHRKHIRLIDAWMEIQAPLYWWKEFDTYRMGVDKVSESTMHTIMNEEITQEDFDLSAWDDNEFARGLIVNLCDELRLRGEFDRLNQLLPQSYLQTRIVKFSYEALHNMYQARHNHKLIEWRYFCRKLEEMPYAEFITGEAES